MSKKPDYSTHEALHMTSFLMHSIEQELIEHDAIQSSPNWLALAEAASKALHDLYQSIGEAHLVDNDASVFDVDSLLSRAPRAPTGKLSDRAPFDEASPDETVRDKAALAWLALEEGKEPAGCQGLEDVEDPCPKCGAPLLDAKGGGEHCSKCSYWFCY